MITSEQLAEWKRIEQLATPGPWCREAGYEQSERGNFVASEATGGLVCAEQDGTDCDLSNEDARFIAASRTALPALIAEVERLRKIEQAALEWRAIRTEKLPADLDGSDVTVSVYAIEEAERKLDALLMEEEPK